MFGRIFPVTQDDHSLEFKYQLNLMLTNKHKLIFAMRSNHFTDYQCTTL